MEAFYNSQKISASYFMCSNLVGENICVDATFYHHYGRYINHCCPPEANAVPVLVTGTKQLAIEAGRDIKVLGLGFGFGFGFGLGVS